MGEVGCLKDGNFQNLETAELHLNGNRLNTTTYVSIGGIAAEVQNIVATDLTKNAVNIINGNGTDHGSTITLPSKAEIATLGLVVGDFYTFVVGSQSTASGGHIIMADAAADGAGAGAYLIGGVRLIRAAAGTVAANLCADATAATPVTGPAVTSVYPIYGTDERIVMQFDDGTGGGGSGSHVTFRYMGAFGLGTTVHWMLSGEILSNTAVSTGVTLFTAFGG
jgi:hypothetical protein